MTHSDVKRYTCPACGKQLKNDSCYRRHMVCVHGQKYSCELCSKDYSALMGLNIHKRDVHGIITWIKIFTILSQWINLGIFSRKLFRRIKLSPLKIMCYRCGKYAPPPVVYRKPKYLTETEYFHYSAFGFGRRNFILDIQPSILS